MVTNLKDKFKLLVHPVILSLLLSIFFVSSYPILKETAIPLATGGQYYFKSSTFGNTLGHMTQYLKQTRFDGALIGEDPRFEEVENLKYFIHDKERGLAITNTEDISLREFKSLMGKSKFSARINFGKDYYTLDGTIYGESFTSNYTANLISEYLGCDTIEAYYIVPPTLSSTEDFITRNMDAFKIYPYTYLLLMIGAISIIVLIVINTIIPYRIQTNFRICTGFNKLFLEFKLLLLAALGFMFSFFYSGIADDRGSLFYINSLILEANTQYYIVGIFFAFMTFLLGTLLIISIKSIYHTGFKVGFVKRIGMLYLLSKLYHVIAKWFKMLLDIHITQPINRKFILIAIINFLILSVLGLALYSRLTVILALLYSIALSYYLYKQAKKVEKLHSFSQELALGHFDTTCEEDLGFLQPICENLNIINGSFKLAVEQEVRSQNMKTELISNVSHDLKTPLTSIITYIDLLKNDQLPSDKQTQYITILDNKSKRLKILIEDLFEVSKTASGTIDLDLQPLDLVALLQQTLGELDEKLTTSGLQLRPSFPDAKLICHLDGRKTYRIFENLISNIIKYAQPGSRVYIEVTSEDGLAKVTFKNISAYEMNFDPDEIIHRFKRGDTSRNSEGSGLGLAIAKNLTELQQGTLTLHIDGDLFKAILTFPLIERSL